MGAFLDEYGLHGLDAEEFHANPGPAIVFVFREFQYAGDTFGDGYVFAGPCLSDPAATDPRPSDWEPPADDRPLVLVSLGTTYNDRPDFFRDCVAAFAGQPVQVLIALGGRVAPDALGPLPENVQAHRWLPFGPVLERASVFVNQAGMGSVMRGLWHGTPMVLAPMQPESYLISERLAQLGVGAVVNSGEVSAERLRAAVLGLVADADAQRAAQVLRGQVRAADGPVAAADALEACLRAPTAA
jgi:MGT family glycosyltransferase